MAKTLKFTGIFLLLLITSKISANGLDFELLKFQTMYYKLMRPLNFDVNTKYPVVICLHNSGQMDNDSTNFPVTTYGGHLALPQVRLDYPAYVIVPKTNKLWNLDDLSKIKDIIAGLPSVDMSRIYIVGHSAGGQGTLLFIETEPQYFAAAIACSAYGNRVKNRQGLINFNLWSTHGDADTSVPYDKDYSFFNAMKALNARMKFTTYFGLKHGQTDEYIFGINDIDSTVISLNAKQYKTEFAGPDSDPEPNTLKWLFSKSSNAVTSADNVKNADIQPVIYPNPTSSYVYWSQLDDLDEVIVYYLSGVGVAALKIQKPVSNYIDIGNLNNGVYFINLKQKNQIISTQKVIKR